MSASLPADLPAAAILGLPAVDLGRPAASVDTPIPARQLQSIVHRLRDLVSIPLFALPSDGTLKTAGRIRREEALHDVTNLIRREVRAPLYIYKDTTSVNGVEYPSFIICNRPNVDSGESRSFKSAFIGHLETVGTDTSLRFGDQVKGEGNRLYGRGTIDMLGQVAVLMELFDDHRTDGMLDDVALVLTTEEENGGFNGTKHLIDTWGLRADTYFLPDGGYGFSPVVSQKGVLQLTLSYQAPGNLVQSLAQSPDYKIINLVIDATGPSAHGSRPFLVEEGTGVVQKLGLAMDRISADPLVASLEVLRVQIGDTANKVPESGNCVVRLVVDRSLPGPVTLPRVAGVNYQRAMDLTGIDQSGQTDAVYKQLVVGLEKVLSELNRATSAAPMELSVNPGIIVADNGEGKLSLDVRFPPELDSSELITRIHELAAASRYSVQYEEPGFTAVQDEKFKFICEIIERRLGRPVMLQDEPGSGDARHLPKGSRCLIFSPDGADHHTASEWVDSQSLLKFYQVVEDILRATSGPAEWADLQAPQGGTPRNPRLI